MKYALIPVLDELDAWMKAHEYDKLSSLDEFMNHVGQSPAANDCAEWLWEIYRANN